MTTPFRITTVCTGNICRSPMAEFMVAHAAVQAGVDLVVDSAGISAWEVGNPIDPRASRVLARHGIAVSHHTARRFDPAWFAERELILALDTDHFEALQAMAPSPEDAAKVRMLRSFDPEVSAADTQSQGIYDPWFGDESDFDTSWRLIAAAIPGILAYVRG